ncbi:MAG: phospholipase [Saprospiraceae bacterium]|nr:phospholipase [Saprospiraceae bacterium]
MITSAFSCHSDGSYPYLIYHPEGYDSESQSKYPLLIFLHGSGESGDDLSLVEKHGPPMMIKNGHDFTAIVVSPQKPIDSWWEVSRLESTLKEILSGNNVDLNRIYLTGLSMGGYGTFAWSIAYPERFAALAPVCGGGDPEKAGAIKDIPTWVFHGAKDNVVPLIRSQEMVDAIKAAGGNPQFTIYPEADHDSWSETYANEAFWTWLFAQEKN